MPLPFPLQMQLQTLLKAPLERAPLFSKVSFRKKRTLNGVLYLNWLSESILLATLFRKLFSSQKIFYERVFNSCPESEISFILFTFLWASSYCNCRRFQRPFFSCLPLAWNGKGSLFPTRDTRVFHLYPIFRYVDFSERPNLHFVGSAEPMPNHDLSGWTNAESMPNLNQ